MPSPFPTSAVDAPNRNAALLALAARTGVFVHPGPGEDEDEDDPIQVRPVRQIAPAKRL